jgi:hypothetical protein
LLVHRQKLIGVFAVLRPDLGRGATKHLSNLRDSVSPHGVNSHNLQYRDRETL